jgi:DNA mismatch endonuclease (patch repair protein)
MSRIRGADTEPEKLVRLFLRSVGIHYRLNAKRLPGRPDIVVPRARTAIFVHGCYWHRHEGCPLTTTPKSNAEFWARKFAGTVERDRRKEQALRELGWVVEVVWECEIERPGVLDLLALNLLVSMDE